MIRFALSALLPLLLAACAAGSHRNADVIILNAHGGGSALAISPDSRLLASGGKAGRIRISGLPDGQRKSRWQAHDGEVTGLTFVRGGRLLSSGYDGNLTLWTLHGRKLTSVPTGSAVTAMAADPARDRLLTGHADGTVRPWRLADLSPERTLGQHEERVLAVAIGADGKIFAASDSDGHVLLWGLNAPVNRLPSPRFDVHTLAFSADGRLLFGAGWFDLFRWDLPKRTLRTLATEHRGIITSIQLGREGAYLASISRQTDSAVLFLDPASGRTLMRFQPHDLCGNAVRLSPDGRILVTTADDASVRIWELGGETPAR
jgi:WD40 repeat protein